MSGRTSGRRAASARRRGGWARLAESVESRLWPIPVVVILAAVGVGLALPRIDLLVDGALPLGVDSFVFNGGADTARSVLSSIAGSLITATSLTFSLTVVALQLASSQASPRVLRMFARDRHVHWTLATFLGTFAFAITVLRTIRSEGESAAEFVPRVSVTLAFVLTLVSMVMLVLFLAHLAAQLRVETILKEIHAETDDVIDRESERHSAAVAFAGAIVVPPHRHVVTADQSGFVTSRDRLALVEAGTKHGIVIQEARHIGENVVAGTPLAYWWSSVEAAAPDREAVEALEESVRCAHVVGYERTSSEDVDFGIQQILDIALRALSPGVNDPTTAVHALGHLSAITVRTAAMSPMPPGLADGAGALRVVTSPVTSADRIRAALSPMRHHGAASPAVVDRLLQTVDELAYVTGEPGVRDELGRQLAALEEQLQVLGDDPATTRESLRRLETVRDRLRGDGDSAGFGT